MDSKKLPRLFSFSAVLLLLALLSSSTAQSNTNPTTESPTILQTLASPTSEFTPPPTASSIIDDGNRFSQFIFNYYFVLVALVIVIACGIMFCVRTRKRRKAALIRSGSQRALARDVAGFRSRFGIGGTSETAYRSSTRTLSETEDGLNERGEPPPPYVPATKPPSVRTTDGRADGRSGQLDSGDAGNRGFVELLDIRGAMPHEPPAYNAANSGIEAHGTGNDSTPTGDAANPPPQYLGAQEDTSGTRTGFSDSSGIARPPAAVTVPESYSFTLRSPAHTRSVG